MAQVEEEESEREERAWQARLLAVSAVSNATESGAIPTQKTNSSDRGRIYYKHNNAVIWGTRMLHVQACTQSCPSET